MGVRDASTDDDKGSAIASDKIPAPVRRQRVGAGAYVSAQQRTGPPSAGSMRV
jgi:hypothetical protein